jgi:DNA (cytosine-5)-methyltransferase 1
MTLKVGGICAGYGGLELATGMMWADAEPAWFSEIDPTPAYILERRFPGVPNIGDITAAGRPPACDVITAGFPCQPASSAGKRSGMADDRWIWPSIADVIRQVSPGLVLLENVRGILSVNGGAAWEQVRSDLDSAGYDVAWSVVKASDVGACHQRARLFVAAVARGWVPPATRSPFHDPGVTPPILLPRIAPLLPTPNAWDGSRGPDLARANRPDSGGMDLTTTVERLLPTPTARDHKGPSRMDGPDLPMWAERMAESWGDYTDAVARHTITVGRRPPPPNRRDNGRLSSAFVEWMMMLPAGWVTGAGRIPRSKRLRALGNGVVPAQAAHAYHQLLTAGEQQLTLEIGGSQ